MVWLNKASGIGLLSNPGDGSRGNVQLDHLGQGAQGDQGQVRPMIGYMGQGGQGDQVLVKKWWAEGRHKYGGPQPIQKLVYDKEVGQTSFGPIIRLVWKARGLGPQILISDTRGSDVGT